MPGTTGLVKGPVTGEVIGTKGEATTFVLLIVHVVKLPLKISGLMLSSALLKEVSL